MEKEDSLLYACWINDIELIKEKLKSVKPSHFKKSTIETGTPIHAAALNGNKEAIDLLLEAGVNIEQGNFLSNNAMLTCIENGKLDMAKYLIEKGSDINKKGCQNRNALSQLILYSWDKAFATYLLDKGCLVNATSRDKESLLGDAAAKNNTEAMNFLFEHGIDKSYMNPAMCWAIIYNATGAVRLFLQMGADLNEMYASCKGVEKSLYHDMLALNNRGSREEMIRLLVDAGVDFKQTPQRPISVGLDKTKLSPYDYAIERSERFPELSDFISTNITLLDQLIAVK